MDTTTTTPVVSGQVAQTAGRVTTPDKAPAPQTPEVKALAALRKATPNTPEGDAALAVVGRFVLDTKATDSLATERDSIAAHLAEVKARHDGAVAYRQTAISVALGRGFTGKAIAETFGVSPSTVSFIRSALAIVDTAKAAKGSVSLREAVAVTSNLQGGRKALDPILATVKATGALPESTKAVKSAGTPRRERPAAVLARAQSVTTAVKSMDFGPADAATLGAIVATLRTALDAATKAQAAAKAPQSKTA